MADYSPFEAVVAMVVPFMDLSELLELRRTNSRISVSVEARLEELERLTEAKAKRIASFLRSYAGNDGQRWKRTTISMRRAAREMRQADLGELLAAGCAPASVKPVLAILELLLGPNAGPEALRHWAFLRKSLAPKWSAILTLLRQDSLEVVAGLVSMPTRLARVKEATMIVRDSGLDGASPDFLAKSSRFCGLLWPALLGLLELASTFDETDDSARRAAIDFVRAKTERRRLAVAAVLRQMPLHARRNLAMGRLAAALPLLTTDIELFVVSRFMSTSAAKCAIMRRRRELTENRRFTSSSTSGDIAAGCRPSFSEIPSSEQTPQ